METVVIVLMILVCFNFVLKQTFRKPWSVAAVSVAAALATGLSWPWAIRQSKTQVADWLADTGLMLDMSVALTVEVALQMAFCLLAVHVLTSGPLRRRTLRAYRFLRWFPGALVFPVLFGGLAALIFSFPGASFAGVAWGMAAGVAAAVPAGTWALRRLLPEKEVRLELLFLTLALTAVLGVVATTNGRTAVAAAGEVDWRALAAVAALVAAGGAAGFLLYRRKRIKTNF